MATSKDFLNYLTEQLRDVPEVSFRPMMGEYLVYYKGKMLGDICDNRLLVKPVQAAKKLLPEAEMQLPYEGAKTQLILVENIDDCEFLKELFEAVYAELPEAKCKARKSK
ncbi:MAG: TfoX/Sxy family protein [Clostridia bacterium]|nr:TfoX/Sxy family protein [Clostridia bacterium]